LRKKSEERTLKNSRFKKNVLSKFLLFPLILSLNGCIYLVVGGIGAVGGYIVSPDTVEGITEHDTMNAWDAAVEVVSIMGIITERHEDAGVIIAEIHGAHVTVTITSINQSTVKVNVKARKAYLPKISVAQDVYVKIMNSLNE
jgi:hypothetical protein